MHRCGIGTALLAGAQERSSGSLDLYTFAQNRIACSFYERHGFVVQRRGFEPGWQLDDVLYRWERGQAIG
jgi:ribosomal protein S18 acetylase RimI-like enzyme